MLTLYLCVLLHDTSKIFCNTVFLLIQMIYIKVSLFILIVQMSAYVVLIADSMESKIGHLSCLTLQIFTLN